MFRRRHMHSSECCHYVSKHRPDSYDIWSIHFTHYHDYAFVKTNLLITCEETTSKHPILGLKIRNIINIINDSLTEMSSNHKIFIKYISSINVSTIYYLEHTIYSYNFTFKLREFLFSGEQ